MSDLKSRIDELAQLMNEFGLEQSKISGDGWTVEFSRNLPSRGTSMVTAGAVDETEDPIETPAAANAPANNGTPINSPMTGIYYSAPNPGAPPFVKEGDHVTAGQVVGLIEAMKVFNEITATVSGTVTAIPAESGRLVQPGDPLLYIA